MDANSDSASKRSAGLHSPPGPVTLSRAGPGASSRRKILRDTGIPPHYAWCALALVLAAILGFGGVYSYVWAPVDLGLFLCVSVLFWQSALRRLALNWQPLLWPMTGFFFLVALQWRLHWSAYSAVTLTGLVQLAGCGCAFYLVLSSCHSEKTLFRLAWVLWLFCGLLSLEALFQYFGANNYIYWFHNATYAWPIGPYVYHNYFAGCMDLLLPLALCVALRAGRSTGPYWLTWLRRGIFPALGFVAVLISRSRGGIFALVFELILAAIIFAPELRKRRTARRALFFGSILLVSFGFLAHWGPVLRRLGHLNGHDPSFLDRWRVSISCWHIFLAHPWFGVGFNAFSVVYPAYQLFDNGQIFLFAHNDYAQMLAETGIAGLICVVAFLLFWLHNCRSCRIRKHPPRVQSLQLAAFIGTAGFMFHALGDFQFHAPANALLFFAVLAMAVARIETA